MAYLLSILFSILLTTQSFSLTPSEYQHLSVKCLKPIFEDLPSESEYYKNLSKKISSLSEEDGLQKALVKPDFANFDRKENPNKELSLKRLKMNFNQKLFFKLSKKPRYLLDEYIDSWLRHALTANEKTSFNYILSLRSLELDKASSPAERGFVELMNTFEAPAISEYQKRGFTKAEANYARRFALLQEMLLSMAENFSPELYFHVESALKVESKILWQAHVEEKLIDFSLGKIECTSDYENGFQPLFKRYFERRAALIEKNLFQTFS